MFNTLRQRFRDMHTISALCKTAEALANASGQQQPGAEHLVLSALELPDGTARKAFERMHTDPNGFRAAIAQQYEDALHNVGIAMSPLGALADDATPVAASQGAFNAQTSFAALIQTLHGIKRTAPGGGAVAPLLGAHVILAASTTQFGVAARALKAMGVDSTQLAEAARAEIVAYQASRP